MPKPTRMFFVRAARAVRNTSEAEQWEYSLKRSPEFASILGDRRYNDRWSDTSFAAIAADLEQGKSFLARFSAIDTIGFPEQEVLNQQLMVRQLKEQLDNARFEDWLMPVNQFSGVHLGLAELVSQLPFATTKDFDSTVATGVQMAKESLDLSGGLPRINFDSSDLAALADPAHYYWAFTQEHFDKGIATEKALK